MIAILSEYSLIRFSMRLTSIPSLNCILAELASLYRKKQYFMIPSDNRSLKGSLAGSLMRLVLLFRLISDQRRFQCLGRKLSCLRRRIIWRYSLYLGRNTLG